MNPTFRYALFCGAEPGGKINQRNLLRALKAKRVCGWVQLIGWFSWALKSPVPNAAAAAAKPLQSCLDSVQPHRRQPTRLPRPWDSPGKNTGVGFHFLLQCMHAC